MLGRGDTVPKAMKFLPGLSNWFVSLYVLLSYQAVALGNVRVQPGSGAEPINKMHAVLTFLIWRQSLQAEILDGRDLEKKEKEEKDKLADEKRRKERKNRDRFKDMLRQHKDEGKLHFRSKWRVCAEWS